MSTAKRDRKKREGVVISDKMDKTCVVHVSRLAQHPVYKKTVKKFVNLKVHDEKNEAKEGDNVIVMETRPLSKDKRWRLVEILKSKKR
ncbi:MAG: 30S ribosomal protein S17 [Candidatus Omnitrophota bacterium]